MTQLKLKRVIFFTYFMCAVRPANLFANAPKKTVQPNLRTAKKSSHLRHNSLLLSRPKACTRAQVENRTVIVSNRCEVLTVKRELHIVRSAHLCQYHFLNHNNVYNVQILRTATLLVGYCHEGSLQYRVVTSAGKRTQHPSKQPQRHYFYTQLMKTTEWKQSGMSICELDLLTRVR